ncbi:MAG TPA: Spy/CpxP family protein refolding chaperone [Candidatus Binatia bacterium]|nr:Spy/CpxP family protein refolding chaperone [Candidatus Binatia bacterium]
MTLKKIALIGGVIAFAASLGLSTVLADPGFGRPGMWRMGAPLFSQLQLSDTQRSEIHDIFTNSRDTIRPLMQQLHEKQAALRQSSEGAFDEAAVRSQAQDIASIQAQLIVARAHIRNQVLGILTDEQKARLSELRAERMQQFREWRRQHAGPSEQS